MKALHVGLLAAGLLFVTQLRAEPEVRANQRIPMRDGVRLATDLYLPRAPRGPVPVILTLTPYNKDEWRRDSKEIYEFVEQGFAVAIQDIRGTYNSEGRFDVHYDFGRDGYDTVQWLASQPWSNGRVGTMGCSAQGMLQVALARMRPPALAAQVINAPGAIRVKSPGQGNYHVNGIFRLGHTFSWLYQNGQSLTYKPSRPLSDEEFASVADSFSPAAKLPELDLGKRLSSLPVVSLMDDMPSLNDFREIALASPRDPFVGFPPDSRVGNPIVWVNSWYDGTASSTIELFRHARAHATSRLARDNQFLVISPAAHCQTESLQAQTRVGERDLGDARWPFIERQAQFLAHFLKGESAPAAPPLAPVQYYLMGRNEWRSAEDWPVPGTRPVKFHLETGGRLSREPAKAGGADRYTYDPQTPTPAMPGGAQEGAMSPVDHRSLELRSDVITYSTEPLREPLAVIGPIEVTLYVSSSAPDTDFTAKLLDVYPDGRAFNLAQSIMRARYREGFDREKWMKPGQVYRLTFQVGDTANEFLTGHQLRLEVASSAFPLYARNLNIAGNSLTESRSQIAVNAVHSGGSHDSHVLVYVESRERSHEAVGAR